MQEQLLQKLKEEFNNSLEHLKKELVGIRTGRAHASLVEDVFVECYNSKMPLKQLASISIPEARTIVISPWDKSSLKDIQKSIEIALETNVQNDGNVIRVSLPALTEERRKDLVKVVGKKMEESRIAMRNTRHDIINELDNSGISETDIEIAKKKIQEEVDKFNKDSDKIAKEKEEEILKV